MAYLTCPWCRSPQLVSDDAPGYQCFVCYGDIGFTACKRCGVLQTVNKRWTAFTCSKCEARGDLPRRWGYDHATRAALVEATAHPYPKL